MHTLRGIWRASPLLKRTVATVGAVYVGTQIKNTLYPESNVARAYFWNSSPKTPSPPSASSPPQPPSLQVGPYGPTALPFSGAEMCEITKSAVQLYRVCFVGNELGVVQFVQLIARSWEDFAKEVRMLPNEDEVKQKIQNQAKQFNAKLSKGGNQALEKILPILGVKNVEQIFAEAAQKVRDPKTVTVAESLPHSMRVIVRFTELRKWNEYLSLSDEPDIEMLRTTPPAQIPDRHADYFLAKLKKEHPKLDDDVANLLRDVARFRAKLGVLQNFFAGMPTDELSDYDTRYNWLVSATQWAAEYREAKKSQPALQYSKFVTDKAKQEYPQLSPQDFQIVVAMANEFYA